MEDRRPDGRPNLRLVVSNDRPSQSVRPSPGQGYGDFVQRYIQVQEALTYVLGVSRRDVPGLDEVVATLSPEVHQLLDKRASQGLDDHLLLVPRIADVGLYDTRKGGLLGRLAKGLGSPPPVVGVWRNFFRPKDERLDTPGHTRGVQAVMLLGGRVQNRGSEAETDGVQIVRAGIGPWIVGRAVRHYVGEPPLDEPEPTTFPQYGLHGAKRLLGGETHKYAFVAAWRYGTTSLEMVRVERSGRLPVQQMIVLSQQG